MPSRTPPQPGSTSPRIPPTAFVLSAVLSVQLGSALATHLFQETGPAGVAFLRVAFGALILLAVWRPRPWRHDRSGLWVAILFGLATAALNLVFYSALARIPLGIAVTLEFVGPLGVAVAGSRRLLDALWVGLAAAGILLLAPWGRSHLDPLGIVLGLLAGVFWGLYIILSAQVGRRFPGGTGLSIALIAGTIAMTPIGIWSAGHALLVPRALAIGLGVGLLSAVIPYSLELEALRSIPTRAFGVLMSTEPAVAAVIGFVFLRQVLTLRALFAVVLVTLAALGSSGETREEEPPGAPL